MYLGYAGQLIVIRTLALNYASGNQKGIRRYAFQYILTYRFAIFSVTLNDMRSGRLNGRLALSRNIGHPPDVTDIFPGLAFCLRLCG
jgi:hypothetical protein